MAALPSSRARNSKRFPLPAKRSATGEKRRLAEHAATLIEPGQSVNHRRQLDGRSDRRVSKGYSSAHRHHQQSRRHRRSFGSPGHQPDRARRALQQEIQRLFGVVTEEALRSLRADVAFLSSSAVEGAVSVPPGIRGRADQAPDGEIRQPQISPGGPRQVRPVGPHFLTGLEAFDAVLTGSEVSEENTGRSATPASSSSGSTIGKYWRTHEQDWSLGRHELEE